MYFLRAARRATASFSAPVSVLVLSALFVLGCDDGATGLLEAGRVSAAKGGGGSGTLVVTVLAPDGSTVGDRTVIAVAKDAGGPYRADGTLRSGITGIDGEATIEVERGDYCVYTTPVQVASLVPSAGQPPTVPPVGGAQKLGGIAAELGTALTGAKAGGDFESLPLTLANWTTWCLGTPPVTVRGNTSLTLELQPGAGPVVGAFVSPDGGEPSIASWLLVDLSSLSLPWSLPASSVADVKPGLFVAAQKASGVDGAFSLPSPGGPVAVESELVSLGGGFTSASARLGDKELDAGVVPIGAEFCLVNEAPETVGDASDGVDFIGPYRHGFLADAYLEPVTTVLAVEYRQAGVGTATFKLRERTNGTDQLKVDYACDAAGCQTGKAVGSLLGAPGFGVSLSAREVTASTSRSPEYFLTWVISGLPASDVETGADTNGDQVPDASKSAASSALVATPVPASCESEESRFILGG